MKLEESAKRSDETTEQEEEAIGTQHAQQPSLTTTPVSQRVYKSLSKDVRPDYTCYYIFSSTAGLTRRSVAVVIEAKLTTPSNYRNVIPQVSLLTLARDGYCSSSVCVCVCLLRFGQFSHEPWVLWIPNLDMSVT